MLGNIDYNINSFTESVIFIKKIVMEIKKHLQALSSTFTRLLQFIQQQYFFSFARPSKMQKSMLKYPSEMSWKPFS